MSRHEFLLDESAAKWIVRAMVSQQPEMSFDRIGFPGMPPLGSKDTEILSFCAAESMSWVTLDRKSIWDAISAMMEKGEAFGAVFLFKDSMTMEELAENLIILWELSTFEEWEGCVKTFPL